MASQTTEWKIDDYLKTPEQRAFYLEAAIEEAQKDGDLKFLAIAFADVARAVGEGAVSTFMVGVSTGLSSFPTGQAHGTGAAIPAPQAARHKAARRKAAKRELARA